ncbi:MAG: hypothetical protein ACRDSL_22415 [Pseudonocardiaceae bacterium]
MIGRLDARAALDSPGLLAEPVRVALAALTPELAALPGAEVVDGLGRGG